jgi:hypothetical protein
MKTRTMGAITLLVAGLLLGSASWPTVGGRAGADRVLAPQDDTTATPAAIPVGVDAGLPPAVSGPTNRYVASNGQVFWTIYHTPRPDLGDSGSTPAAPGQNLCPLGDISTPHGTVYSWLGRSNVNGAIGYVPAIKDLYPCTSSGGVWLSDTWVLPANVQAGTNQIAQVFYGKWDGSGLHYGYTYQDNCNGCWALWEGNPYLYPIVGHYVRFMTYNIHPSTYKWRFDVYDVTAGIEEYTDIDATWTAGTGNWWGFETDNSNCVQGQPQGYPYVEITTWEYRTTSSSSWYLTYNLPFYQQRPSWTFYQGGLTTKTYTHDTVVAWTTNH